jgi:hypothetical protein
MPRKSAAARAMEPLIPHEEPVPVQPPPTLSEAARAVFLDLVSSCDPEHFKQSDVTMLAQYLRGGIVGGAVSGRTAERRRP